MTTDYIHTLIKYSISYLIVLFVELLFRLGYAACQACFGNTPGKQLFGIKIIDASGRSINFQKAFKREMLVLFKGQGLGLPIIYLFAMYRGYKNLKKHKITTWDKQMHLTVSYRIQSLWVRLVGVTILIVSIILILPLYFLLSILVFGCIFFIWFILI
ncbi:RDD family protein [Candidatus Cardinium hertigii]|uniref:RDD family protein n=1 Tax=Candidatus Cardinium hertigii TaxID=247481 RepID=UPI003D7CD993